MKPMLAFAACALLTLGVAACSGGGPKPGTVIAYPPPSAPPPPEGVYPDCRFGVLPPDDPRSPACAPPAVN